MGIFSTMLPTLGILFKNVRKPWNTRFGKLHKFPKVKVKLHVRLRYVF